MQNYDTNAKCRMQMQNYDEDEGDFAKSILCLATVVPQGLLASHAYHAYDVWGVNGDAASMAVVDAATQYIRVLTHLVDRSAKNATSRSHPYGKIEKTRTFKKG